MLTLREAVPTTHRLRNAEFATLRRRLLKLGARVNETVSRIGLTFAAACPEASLFPPIPITLQPAALCAPGHQSPNEPASADLQGVPKSSLRCGEKTPLHDRTLSDKGTKLLVTRTG